MAIFSKIIILLIYSCKLYGEIIMPVRTDMTKYRNIHKQNVIKEYEKNPEKFLVTKKEAKELLEKQRRVDSIWNKLKSIVNMEETISEKEKIQLKILNDPALHRKILNSQQEKNNIHNNKKQKINENSIFNNKQ